MGLEKNTSVYTNEKKRNVELEENLEELLEMEMKKNPGQMNVEKIDSIIVLLNQLTESKEEEFDKEKFSEKYLQPYIKSFKKEENYGIFISVKAIIIMMALGLSLGTGNHLVVKATGHGILENIKRKADIFYFDLVKKQENEIEPYENFSADQQTGQFVVKEFSSWEEMEEKVGRKIKIPCYIPENMSEEKIHYLEVGDHNFELSRSYRKNDQYILFQAGLYRDMGKLGILSQGKEELIFEKRIGDFYAAAYQGEDSILAFFEEDQVMYIIETNLSDTDLEKFIKEIR